MQRGPFGLVSKSKHSNNPSHHIAMPSYHDIVYMFFYTFLYNLVSVVRREWMDGGQDECMCFMGASRGRWVRIREGWCRGDIRERSDKRDIWAAEVHVSERAGINRKRERERENQCSMHMMWVCDSSVCFPDACVVTGQCGARGSLHDCLKCVVVHALYLPIHFLSAIDLSCLRGKRPSRVTHTCTHCWVDLAKGSMTNRSVRVLFFSKKIHFMTSNWCNDQCGETIKYKVITYFPEYMSILKTILLQISQNIKS